MHGYWKDPQRTSEALQVHPNEPEITWMRTGDLGTMDKEGYVRIVGRSKDVIIRGGRLTTICLTCTHADRLHKQERICSQSISKSEQSLSRASTPLKLTIVLFSSS